MTHKHAIQIARMQGDNPAAEYFNLDPELFNLQRVGAILSGYADALWMRQDKLVPNGALETYFCATLGPETSARYDSTPESVINDPDSMQVYISDHIGVGFVEISTSNRTAATRKYRSLVGKLTDLGSKVRFDGPAAYIVKAISEQMDLSDSEVEVVV